MTTPPIRMRLSAVSFRNCGRTNGTIFRSYSSLWDLRGLKDFRQPVGLSTAEGLALELKLMPVGLEALRAKVAVIPSFRKR